MTSLPHFLRVARGLALLSSVGSAGCASMVVPYDPDADVADGNVPNDGNVATTDRPDNGLLSNGCPRSRPYPYGARCETEGLVCDPDPCNGLLCRVNRNGDGTTWQQQTICNGPLPPPEDFTV